MPSCLILMASLTSLSLSNPHSQRNVRSESDRDSLTRPQHEHVLDEGNHLSILISFFPCSASLYWRKVVNMPQPLSWTPWPKWRACDIPFMLRSSMTTQSYRFANLCDSLCRKSLRWLAIFSCSFATFRRCLCQRFEPFFLRDNLRCSFANVSNALLNEISLKNS